MCEHKFVFLESHKRKEMGSYNSTWEKTDTFFCEKCLEYKDKTRRESSRDKPEWY